MIDIKKMSGEIRKSVLSILRAYYKKFGENGSGYLFDFSEKIAPFVFVQDPVSTRRYYKVQCSSVNLVANGDKIEIFLESDDDSGLEFDCWINLDEVYGFTEIAVYKAIIDQLFKDNRNWLVQQDQFYQL